MRKKLAYVLSCVMLVLTCAGCAEKPTLEAKRPASFDPNKVSTNSSTTSKSYLDKLLDAAQAEGSLVVYGSCEEEYLSAACKKFEKLYQIDVEYERLSSGEVQSRIEAENGKPSADVWFGGTTDPYNVLAANGLLMSYEAENASHLQSEVYRDKDGYWYGIYKGILGFMVNTKELTRLGLDAPKDWADLTNPDYKGLIWSSNYNTSGTAKLVLNTMIQKYGYEKGLNYLVELDKNVEVYTKSGSGPAKNVGTGECVIGIGFLHDGTTQIVDNGYEDVALVIPESGTSYEIGATAIFEGCENPNAAKLWIEFALSPACVELAANNGSYQFVVLDNAAQPKQAYQFGLDPENVMDYDFEDAKANTASYVEKVFEVLGEAVDERFQTE